MKKFRILISFLITFLIISFGTISTKAATNTVKLDKSNVTIYAKGQINLKMTGSTKKFTWKSNNSKIAKVNQKGVVTAVKPGKAIISVVSGSKKAKCTVTVKKELSTANIVNVVNNKIKKSQNITSKMYSKKVSKNTLLLTIGINKKKKILYLENSNSVSGCDKIYSVGKKTYWHSTSDGKWYYVTESDEGILVMTTDGGIDVKAAKAKGYKTFNKKMCREILFTQDNIKAYLYVDAADYSIVGVKQGNEIVTYDFKSKIEVPSEAKKATYKEMSY